MCLLTVNKFFLTPKSPSTAPVVPGTEPTNLPPQIVNPWSVPPTQALPGWNLQQPLDMHVYLSTSPNGDVFTKWTAGFRKDNDAELPHFVWLNITYGDYNDARVVEYDIKFPDVSRFYSSEINILNCVRAY